MTSARTDWAGWTDAQLDTLIAITYAERLAAAEQAVTERGRALNLAHEDWATAVAVRDDLKGVTGV
jgi:hypothetical protein